MIPASDARRSGKAALRCVRFWPMCRGSLRGFASIAFLDLKMTVHGIGIHVHENGTVWASPPAQAIIKSGEAVKDERGKVAYSPPLLQFDSDEIRFRWSERVIAEVLAYDPHALECRGQAA